MKTSIAGSTLVGALLLVATADAQGVWPAQYRTTPGGSAQNAPFSSFADEGQRTRAMFLLRGSTLPFAANRPLTEIAFRRDAEHRSTTYSQQTGSVRLQIGRARVDALDHPLTHFDSNFAGESSLALLATDIVLPQAAPPGNVAPFSVRLPFTQPWTYPGGDLAIDVVWTGRGSRDTTWRTDAVHVPTHSPALSRQIAQGCAGSTGRVPGNYLFHETAVPGGNLTAGLYGAWRNPAATPGLAIHLLGTSNRRFQGMSLPLDLGQYGYPAGCQLAVNGTFSQIVPTAPSAAGPQFPGHAHAQASFALPADSRLSGARFYSQWMCLDPALQAGIQIHLSNALELTLGSLPSTDPVIGRTIWRFGEDGGDREAGSIASGTYVPILELR